jgi:hypothetical protein
MNIKDNVNLSIMPLNINAIRFKRMFRPSCSEEKEKTKISPIAGTLPDAH